eukprot:87064_1
MYSLILVLSNTFICTLSQSYKLQDSYIGNTFFDGFNFDMSHGGVFDQFVNYSTAKEMGMINTTSNTVYIGTDYTNKVGSSGRPAIQISSKKGYTTGLFILDASHMPQGCGTWPAWWLSGPNWPNSGEIDIIEGINLRSDDQSTLHTNANCDFKGHEPTNITGKWGSSSCVYPPGGGCDILANNDNTFGVPFNKNGGGVFVTELNDNIGIKMWFWQHNEVPSDIVNKKPNPNSWKIPYAFWPFGNWCTSDHFKNLAILFDLYYCGWAANDATWKSQCSTVANGQTCEQFVMNNPQYFRQAYWLVNYLDVYQLS